MSKQDTDSTPDKDADSVLVEAARNGDATAVRVGLEKLAPDTDSTTVAFDAAHEACRGNHDECLTLLLPYIETTQMGFGILLSECVHADHTACTEVLLQHWKSVCSNVAFVPLESKNSKSQLPRPCPAMWGDPVVCQVLIDAGAAIDTTDDFGCSPLRLACGSGRLATVKMLVEAGVGVADTHHQPCTCLMLAAYFGHIDIMRYLVSLPEAGLHDLDLKDRTALHFATQEKHTGVVQVLLEAGADIEEQDMQSRTPLHWSVVSGDIATVKMLVEAGAELRDIDFEDTCLMLAARNGHTDIVRYLVGLPGVDLEETINCETALLCACRENHPGVVGVLIDAGAHITVRVNRRTLLHFASMAGHLGTLEKLIEAGAKGVHDMDDEGYTCLMYAAQNGHTEIVRYLVGLPGGVNMEQRKDYDHTALTLALQRRHAGVAEVLIGAGADVNSLTQSRLTPLQILCSTETPSEENCTRVVQMLIDRGACIERTDEKGRTLVQLASIAGELAIVQVLIKAGAGVRVTDDNGNTCLMHAAENGRTETVRYLVGLPEVDVNHRNNYGCTALERALECVLLRRRETDAVHVLIDAGADVTVKSAQKVSLLHVATMAGDLAPLKKLIEAGARVRDTDDEGQTCLMLAAEVGHIEIVRYLVGLPEVDVNHRDLKNQTALNSAVKRVHVDVAQVLIDAGAEVDTKDDLGRSLLHWASSSSDQEMHTLEQQTLMSVAYFRSPGSVRKLEQTSFEFPPDVEMMAMLDKKYTIPHDKKYLRQDTSPPPSRRIHCHVITPVARLNMVKMLVKAGAGVRATDSEGYTCLMLAASCGHTEIVRYLVGLPDVDVNHRDINNKTALHCALDQNVPAGVVRVLIDAGTDIDAKDNLGCSHLHLAGLLGQLSNVKMLVEAGAGVRGTDKKGYTCLMLAVYSGHTETVRYLVGLPDVDVNRRDINNHTALHCALERQHTSVVDALIHAGADVNMKDSKGCSLLHFACILGDVASVEILVEAGADVRDTDNETRTSLILAAMNGHTELVRYLVSLPEVDVNHRNSNRHTALQCARAAKHAGVCQVLIAAGADVGKAKGQQQCSLS